MNAMTSADIVLIFGCSVAVYTDLSNGKIPNGLTLPMAAAGLLLNLLSGQGLFSLTGFFAAFVIHFSLWALGVEKGGDAKLMMAVGAVVGWREMLEATLWEALLFPPIGIAVLILRGRMGNFLALLRYFAERARGADVSPPAEQTYILFAPIILCAVMAARLTDWFTLG